MKVLNNQYLKYVLIIGFLGIFNGIFFGQGEFPWIFFFTLIPVIYVAEHFSSKIAFFYGYLFGIFFTAFSTYWILSLYLPSVVKIEGQFSLTFGFLYLSLVYLYFGFYFACLFLGISLLNSRIVSPYKRILYPILWVLIEWIRAHSIIPYDFFQLGFHFSDLEPFNQIAEYFGVYFLSFSVLVINVVLFETGICLFKTEFSIRQRIKGAGLLLLTLISGIVLFYLTSSYRLTHWLQLQNSYFKSDRTLDFSKISLLQPNLPATNILDNVQAYNNANVLLGLSKKEFDKFSDLVVWPERLIQFNLNKQVPDFMLKLMVSKFDNLIVGAPNYQKDEKNKLQVFNSLFWIDRKGVQAIYNKVNLMPFGEYFPFLDSFEVFSKLRHFAVPKNSRPSIFENQIHQIGVGICSDVLHGDFIRSIKAKGPSFMVFSSNEIWLKNVAVQKYLKKITILRAIENRIWVLKASNNGISIVVDALGRVISQANPNQGAIISVFVPNNFKHESFYSKYGDAFVQFFFIVFILILIVFFLPFKMV